MPPDEIISRLTTHIAGLRWEMVQAYITSRIARITNITECPVIYIGSAGTSHKSRHHALAGAHLDRSARCHGLTKPVRVLLWFWMIKGVPG